MPFIEKFELLFVLNPDNTVADYQRETGISHALLSKWRKGSVPGVDSIEKFCEGADVSPNWLLCDIEPMSLTECRLNERKKIIGGIKNKNIELLAQWIMEQDDPNRIAGNIRFMVETRYPDFEEWQKKRGEWREDVGISQNE